jgi:hypothetical protein
MNSHRFKDERFWRAQASMRRQMRCRVFAVDAKGLSSREISAERPHIKNVIELSLLGFCCRA